MVRKGNPPAGPSLRRKATLLNGRRFQRTNHHLRDGQPAEEALRDADRRTNKFLAMLAHEVRKHLLADEVEQ